MRPASGHAFKIDRRRGEQWYLKYRLPNGRQVQKRLGPHYSGGGPTPEGYFTRRSAERELRLLLAKADAGELAGQVRVPRRDIRRRLRGVAALQRHRPGLQAVHRLGLSVDREGAVRRPWRPAARRDHLKEAGAVARPNGRRAPAVQPHPAVLPSSR
jgi:hypothetical protein